MSVFAFALTSHKDVLFDSLIAVLVFWIYRTTNRFIIISAPVLIVCVTVSIIDFHFIMQDPDTKSSLGNFGTLFGRRALITPALLNYLWIDFFPKTSLYTGLRVS
jgi:hypothetical protein